MALVFWEYAMEHVLALWGFVVVVIPSLFILMILTFALGRLAIRSMQSFMDLLPKKSLPPMATFNNIPIEHMEDDRFEQLINVRSIIFKLPPEVAKLTKQSLASNSSSRAEICHHIYLTSSFLKAHFEKIGRPLPPHHLEQFCRHTPREMWSMPKAEYEALLINILSPDDLRDFILGVQFSAFEKAA